MAQVAVITKTFNKENGEPVNYQVIAVTGILDGMPHTLELKATKAEIMLAKILLNSKETPANIGARKSNDTEELNFLDE